MYLTGVHSKTSMLSSPVESRYAKRLAGGSGPLCFFTLKKVRTLERPLESSECFVTDICETCGFEVDRLIDNCVTC